MLQRIRRRLKRDDGNATIMLGIMLIVCLIMIGGTMLDFSKAQHLKSSYIDAAKKATQAGAMEQNSRGFLKSESIGTAIASYEVTMRPAIINVDGYFSRCEDYGDDDVVLTATLTQHSDFGGGERVVSVKRSDVIGAIQSIYGSNYDLKDVNQQSIANVINSNFVPPTLKRDIDRGVFKADKIQLKLTEGTENSVLPVGFKLTGNDEGVNMKCQKINVAARATTFLGAEDGTYD